MQDLSSVLGFFTTNQHTRPLVMQKKPEYSDKIDALRGHLPDVRPEEFKKLPEFVRKDIFNKDFETRCSIFPFVQGTSVEVVAFKIPAFRQDISEGVCTFSEGNTRLAIDSRSLKTEQLAQILADLPNKDKIVQLNLSGCSGLDALTQGEHSLLDGFSGLKQLTLPNSISFTNLEGIQQVREHLEDLDLSGTSVETLKPLNEFTSLSWLTCRACGKLKDLDALKSCQAIKHLVLSECSQLSNAWLQDLQHLPNLRTCDLTKTTTLQDLKPFVGLSNLEKVVIPATANRDIVLPESVEVVVAS